MGKIHLEVEQGRILSQKMNRAAGELFDSAAMLKSQVGKLSGNWTGGGAWVFVKETKECLKKLEDSVDQLEQLGIAINREIDQWVEADSDGSFKQPVLRITPAPDPWASGGGGGGGGWIDDAPETKIPGLDALKAIQKTISLGHFIAKVGWGLEKSAPWLGKLGKYNKALGVIAGFIGDSWKDWNNPLYDTPGEKIALLVVNLAFAMIKTAIKSGIKAAAASLFLAGLTGAIAQGLTGIGIPTGAATVIASAAASTAIWVGAEVSTNLLCDWFKESSLKSELIQKIGSSLDSVFGAGGEQANLSAIPA